MFLQEIRTIIGVAVTSLQSGWRSLFLAEVVFKVISFVLLIPLAIGALHGLLWFSGQGTLTDTDVLFFLLTPVGAVGMALVGTVWLSITALEQATLFTLLVTQKDKNGGIT